ncbi:hypothetical protein D3C80_1039230 [compost metagenome]
MCRFNFKRCRLIQACDHSPLSKVEAHLNDPIDVRYCKPHPARLWIASKILQIPLNQF